MKRRIRRDRRACAYLSRIVFLIWRDTSHPEGGGSEVYVEHTARWLADQGKQVTIVCAAHQRSPADETRQGIRFRRRGGRLSVYLHALWYLLTPEGRRADIVVDVQNGLPFWSPLIRRRPIVALVHHVHRKQWQVIYPGWRGHLGWWLESSVAPRVYRRRNYVTVSAASAHDLTALGVSRERITIVHNGLDRPRPKASMTRSAAPTMCCLGRLVPHKQLEHAIEAVARLRDGISGLSLDIIGEGWWADRLKEAAELHAVEDIVTFHGYVEHDERDALLAGSWIHLVPSLKEGWGIAIMEAASVGVPSIAYSSAGGVCESIVDGVTGALVDDFDDFVAYTRKLITDETLLRDLGSAARIRAEKFHWHESAQRFAAVLERSVPVVNDGVVRRAGAGGLRLGRDDAERGDDRESDADDPSDHHRDGLAHRSAS